VDRAISVEASKPAADRFVAESDMNRVSGLRASAMKFQTWVAPTVRETNSLN
jgi:hypothetical protein